MEAWQGDPTPSMDEWGDCRMKVDMDLSSTEPTGSDTTLLVGQFVRRNGQYGSVSVSGYLTANGVDAITDTRKNFAPDGTVETYGVAQHAGLIPKDWVEFDLARNTRPRAQAYKVVHLRRLPRYAVLPEATIDGYRSLLTGQGWRGDSRPGLWAFRISGGMVLVADMEFSKSKGLRITRASARDVKCYVHDDGEIVRIGTAGGADDVYLSKSTEPLDALNWSNEADHIGRVIRSLAGANDPRTTEIITWLELHHEDGTGRVSAASGDRSEAMDALRSGSLAARLRSDRELMETYLAAAINNEAVREAVGAYAREGHSAEGERLRAELDVDIANERQRRLDALASEVEADQVAALARLDDELAAMEAINRAGLEATIEKAAHDAAERIKELEAAVDERSDGLDRELAAQADALSSAKADVASSEAQLAGIRSETEVARRKLGEVKSEIDRLLAISAHLRQSDPSTVSTRPSGMPRTFPSHPLVDLTSKARLIADNAMLTDEGKTVLRSLLVLLLSGEVPVLSGGGAADLLRVAETIICPGRAVKIEADPTLISVDDFWARPGSGMPTLLAVAADATKDGGAVLVVIRGIERSAARYWLPALADALRNGGLPRGLFICCTVNDREHEEIEALPSDAPHMVVDCIFRDAAFVAAATLLSPQHTVFETLDQGPMPSDLSMFTMMLLGMERHRSLGVTMRAARMVAEAMALLDDEDEAKRIALKFATPTESNPGK